MHRKFRASGADVLQVVRGYIESERRVGGIPSQTRMWQTVKDKLPAATREQAINAMQNIEGRKLPGRPRKTR